MAFYRVHMQGKLKSIVRKVEGFLKKLEGVLGEKSETQDVDLIVPGGDHLALRNRYYSYKNLLLKNNELLDSIVSVNHPSIKIV